MTSTTSGRGKQRLNSMLTAVGLFAVVVGGSAVYASSKDGKGIGVPSRPALNQFNLAAPQPAVSPSAGMPAAEQRDQPVNETRFPEPPLASARAGAVWKTSYRVHRLTGCTSTPAGGANFRRYPSMDARTILGVVRVGESVWMTGQSVSSDGVIWYEVINPQPLAPAERSLSQQGLEAAQIGWIAACFFR